MNNKNHQHKYQIIAILQTGNLAVCKCGDAKLIPSDYHD